MIAVIKFPDVGSDAFSSRQRSLRTFVAVAETGNFTKAAERAGRTQSAVSMQMKKLEETVGAPCSSAARAAWR